MNAEEFLHWLNGFLELSGAQEMNAAQLKRVRQNLALALGKGNPSPEVETLGFCDGCGKEFSNSELRVLSTNNLAGVVMCPWCRGAK